MTCCSYSVKSVQTLGRNIALVTESCTGKVQAEKQQEAVLYRTVDSRSAVGLLEKNVRNRHFNF